MEHNRSAFLTIKDEKIHTIDLYCPEPIPSSRRKNWIAPANLTDEELVRLLESTHFSGDPRDYIWPNSGGRSSLRGGRWGSGAAHPGSNGVAGVRWSAAEADQKIEETIAYHRERNIGFQWVRETEPQYLRTRASAGPDGANLKNRTGKYTRWPPASQQKNSVATGS